MPTEYYTLEDPGTMHVSNPNLPIADVAIRFTDAFYADPHANEPYYALPFRMTDCSLDSIIMGQYDEGGNEVLPRKDYSIVAVKYISTYHGVYYVKGKTDELDAGGNVIATTAYNHADLSRNITRDITTLSRNVIQRPGLADFVLNAKEAVKMTILTDGAEGTVYPVTVEAPDGCIALTDASGTYDGSTAQPQITLNYSFVKGGKSYRVEETLVLRQDPLKDLRFEEWQ
jgi:hypothetical protein